MAVSITQNAVLGDPELLAGLSSIDPAYGDFVTRVAGEVWGKPLIDQKTKALIAVALDVANGGLEPVPFGAHLGMAKKQGATDEELLELLLFCAVYTGFNKAVAAIVHFKEFLATEAPR